MTRSLLYTAAGVLCLGAILSTTNLSTPPLNRIGIVQAQSQPQPSEAERMTLERLATLLQEASSALGSELGGSGLEESTGRWQFTVNERTVTVIADAESDRMRIVTPVVPADTLAPQQVQAMLVANFHSALDARYALTSGTVVSVFLHPLSSLQDTDLRSGLNQVVNLAANFGTSYSSGGLGFVPNGEPQETEPSREADILI